MYLRKHLLRLELAGAVLPPIFQMAKGIVGRIFGHDPAEFFEKFMRITAEHREWMLRAHIDLRTIHFDVLMTNKVKI